MLPLHCAVHTKKLAQVDRALFLHKKEINAIDSNGETSLFVAVANNCCGIVRRLLKHGADASKANYQGQTALHNAARYESPTLTSVLIKAKVDIDAVNDSGHTPFHVAMGSGRYQNAVQLINAGCKVADTLDYRGNTPSCMAAADGIHPLLKMLHEKDSSSVDTPNAEGWTPMHHAVSSCRMDSKKTIDLLMRLGCTTIDATTERGATPLVLSVKHNNIRALRCLVTYSLKSLDAVYNGWTPFLYALTINRWDCARILYHLGANIHNVQLSDYHELSLFYEPDVIILRYELFFKRSLASRLLFQAKRLANQRTSASTTVKRR